ncbi:S-layer homology domain-containing protein [Paenibacillus sp. GCM10027626]|uniref:S-layer homology domain-containing protein n=1 Tax=Paenibacillus sp. GCM10027626 TaxID=3273411 RepID=UPI0036262710
MSGWAKASVEQIVQAGLMNGVKSKRFAPNEHTTRGSRSRDQEAASSRSIYQLNL